MTNMTETELCLFDIMKQLSKYNFKEDEQKVVEFVDYVNKEFEIKRKT